MKKPYIKPQLEDFSYMPEEGYANSVALHKVPVRDYALIEGTDGTTFAASEEIGEYTDGEGEWESGMWTF